MVLNPSLSSSTRRRVSTRQPLENSLEKGKQEAGNEDKMANGKDEQELKKIDKGEAGGG